MVLACWLLHDLILPMVFRRLQMTACAASFGVQSNESSESEQEERPGAVLSISTARPRVEVQGKFYCVRAIWNFSQAGVLVSLIIVNVKTNVELLEYLLWAKESTGTVRT